MGLHKNSIGCRFESAHIPLFVTYTFSADQESISKRDVYCSSILKHYNNFVVELNNFTIKLSSRISGFEYAMEVVHNNFNRPPKLDAIDVVAKSGNHTS